VSAHFTVMVNAHVSAELKRNPLPSRGDDY
jgi:hypothetical protein